jgi:hypothetical protein
MPVHDYDAQVTMPALVGEGLVSELAPPPVRLTPRKAASGRQRIKKHRNLSPRFARPIVRVHTPVPSWKERRPRTEKQDLMIVTRQSATAGSST